MDALVNDESISDLVLARTNRSLEDNSYDPICIAELWDAAANIFGEGGFGTVQAAASDASDILKNALAGVTFFTVNRDLGTNGVSRTKFTAERIGRLIQGVELIANETHPALSKVRLTPLALIQVEILKHLNYLLVIRSPRLAVVEHRGQDIVREIFTAIRRSDGNLLSEDWRERLFLRRCEAGTRAHARQSCAWNVQTRRDMAGMGSRMPPIPQPVP